MRASYTYSESDFLITRRRMICLLGSCSKRKILIRSSECINSGFRSLGNGIHNVKAVVRTSSRNRLASIVFGDPMYAAGLSRLLKKGRLPLTLNCEFDSYANQGMAGGIDARFGYADG